MQNKLSISIVNFIEHRLLLSSRQVLFLVYFPNKPGLVNYSFFKATQPSLFCSLPDIMKSTKGSLAQFTGYPNFITADPM